jgi:hypothetical protein
MANVEKFPDKMVGCLNKKRYFYHLIGLVLKNDEYSFLFYARREANFLFDLSPVVVEFIFLPGER